MKPRRVSSREAWLLAFLPASLLAIGWAAWSGSRATLNRLEAKAAKLPSHEQVHARKEELTRQIEDLRADVRRLESARARTVGAAAARLSKTAPAATLADRFDSFSRAMERGRVWVVSVESVSSAAQPQRQGAAASGGRVPARPQGSSTPLAWRMDLAGAWSDVRSALNDPAIVSTGLVVTSMSMEAQETTGLNRWTIVVSDRGAW